jgi:Asp-tRNA(Asn)/Glu-tRNA(Gln) amidotransferase B subunit
MQVLISYIKEDDKEIKKLRKLVEQYVKMDKGMRHYFDTAVETATKFRAGSLDYDATYFPETEINDCQIFSDDSVEDNEEKVFERSPNDKVSWDEQ